MSKMITSYIVKCNNNVFENIEFIIYKTFLFDIKYYEYVILL